MNPSLGTMEIYKNKTWKKLCTPNWNEDDNILTCQAMGYFESRFYHNAWYNDHNASNATSCSSLTNCINTNKDELQLCKGICHIKIVNCIIFPTFHSYVSQARTQTHNQQIKISKKKCSSCPKFVCFFFTRQK